MTVSAFRDDRERPASKRGLLASAIAWLWPEPLAHEERRGGWLWLGVLIGWMWPTPLQREFDGAKARRAGLTWLMGWAWPRGLDRSLARWWRLSWLWSWLWPGRLMGPDGEICPLAPWHPALQPEFCERTTWRQRVGRKSALAGMMMAATAIASPTFMEGNPTLDGGRINLFRGGAGGDEGGVGGAGGAGGGSGGGSAETGGFDGGGGGGLNTFSPGQITDPNSPPTDPNLPSTGDFGRRRWWRRTGARQRQSGRSHSRPDGPRSSHRHGHGRR